MIVSVLNCPRFLTARGSVAEVSIHVLLLSGTEFRQHLPAVLQIHVMKGDCVSGEQRGGAAEILSRRGVERGY